MNDLELYLLVIAAIINLVGAYVLIKRH